MEDSRILRQTIRTVETEGQQKKAGTVKEKLGRHHPAKSEAHAYYVGRSRRTGDDKQSRMASKCGLMHPP